jgi:hypothetical protein
MKGCTIPLLVLAISLAMPGASTAQEASTTEGQARSAAVEEQALDVLLTASDRLAAARTMTFTARSVYEVPGPTAAPVYLTTESQVTLQRPDKLKVLTQGDGTALEFYYDGKTMMALDPGQNVLAEAEAPSTIDAMLAVALDKADIYFPFDDVIASDPGKVFREGLVSAVHVGQSKLVGGVVTDMVVLTAEGVHGQIWIGADDKLPRMIRVTYPMLPGSPDYVTEYTNWSIDPPVDASTFAPSNAEQAARIEFGHFSQ